MKSYVNLAANAQAAETSLFRDIHAASCGLAYSGVMTAGQATHDAHHQNPVTGRPRPVADLMLVQPAPSIWPFKTGDGIG